jgi:glycosyltransferase involved in cell wall biosynthesis
VNILHVTPSFFPARVYGGPIESTLGLCAALAARGNAVRVLTTTADGPDRVLAPGTFVSQYRGIEIVYCRRRLGETTSPVLLAKLGEFVRRADVIHLTGVYSFPTLPTLLACRSWGKGLLWSPRGALQAWTGSSRPVAKWLWRAACGAAGGRAVGLHATSPQEAVAARRYFPQWVSTVIPNGVDLPSVRPWNESAGFELLFIGRVHPIKALDRLIVALGAIRSVLPEGWRLTVAGPARDHDYMTALTALAQEHRIEQHLQVIGEVSGDVKETLFERSHLVVVPSHSENFGMVVAEALARERPVLASRGTPWAGVEDNGCGRWVDNEPSAMSEALLALVRAPLREMGRCGRLWMAESYGWSSVAVQAEYTYRNLMDQAMGSSA